MKASTSSRGGLGKMLCCVAISVQSSISQEDHVSDLVRIRRGTGKTDSTSSTTTSSNLHIVVQAAGAAPPCTGPWTAAGAGPPVPRFRLRLPHAAALGMGQGPATPLTSSASSVKDGVDLTYSGEQHTSVAGRYVRHVCVGYHAARPPPPVQVPAGISYTPAGSLIPHCSEASHQRHR